MPLNISLTPLAGFFNTLVLYTILYLIGWDTTSATTSESCTCISFLNSLHGPSASATTAFELCQCSRSDVESGLQGWTLSKIITQLFVLHVALALTLKLGSLFEAMPVEHIDKVLRDILFSTFSSTPGQSGSFPPHMDEPAVTPHVASPPSMVLFSRRSGSTLPSPSENSRGMSRHNPESASTAARSAVHSSSPCPPSLGRSTPSGIPPLVPWAGPSSFPHPDAGTASSSADAQDTESDNTRTSIEDGTITDAARSGLEDTPIATSSSSFAVAGEQAPLGSSSQSVDTYTFIPTPMIILPPDMLWNLVPLNDNAQFAFLSEPLSLLDAPTEAHDTSESEFAPLISNRNNPAEASTEEEDFAESRAMTGDMLTRMSTASTALYENHQSVDTHLALTSPVASLSTQDEQLRLAPVPFRPDSPRTASTSQAFSSEGEALSESRSQSATSPRASQGPSNLPSTSGSNSAPALVSSLSSGTAVIEAVHRTPHIAPSFIIADAPQGACSLPTSDNTSASTSSCKKNCEGLGTTHKGPCSEASSLFNASAANPFPAEFGFTNRPVNFTIGSAPTEQPRRFERPLPRSNHPRSILSDGSFEALMQMIKGKGTGREPTAAVNGDKARAKGKGKEKEYPSDVHAQPGAGPSGSQDRYTPFDRDDDSSTSFSGPFTYRNRWPDRLISKLPTRASSAVFADTTLAAASSEQSEQVTGLLGGAEASQSSGTPSFEECAGTLLQSPTSPSDASAVESSAVPGSSCVQQSAGDSLSLFDTEESGAVLGQTRTTSLRDSENALSVPGSGASNSGTFDPFDTLEPFNALEQFLSSQVWSTTPTPSQAPWNTPNEFDSTPSTYSTMEAALISARAESAQVPAAAPPIDGLAPGPSSRPYGVDIDVSTSGPVSGQPVDPCPSVAPQASSASSESHRSDVIQAPGASSYEPEQSNPRG